MTDFKVDLEMYLKGRVWEEGEGGEGVRTLEDVIKCVGPAVGEIERRRSFES